MPRKLLPAFTLIEMMIVISIIGLLAGVAYPLSSLYFRQARDAQRESSLHQLVQAHHTYFTDHNSYPTRNPEPDRANCVSTDLTSGHLKYLPSLPTSPSWDHYDEWCWPNGQYAYGVSTDATLATLIATMEGDTRGNYNPDNTNNTNTNNQNNTNNTNKPSINDLRGDLALSSEQLSTLNSSLTPKSGKYLIHTLGYMDEDSTLTPPSGGWGGWNGGWNTPGNPTPTNPTPNPTPTPSNCNAITQNGYTIPSLNHTETRSTTKIIRNTPSHGDTHYTANAYCNDGNITIRDESSTISCHAGYNLQAGSCVAPTPTNPTPPANCTTQTVQGYLVHMLYHNGTRKVYKSFPWSPPNGTTNYTATAKCNNGTITITGEQWSVTCDYGYREDWWSCVASTPIGATQSCYIANGTGQQTWNGSSWSSCQVVSCNAGYTQSGNSCVPSTPPGTTISCYIANGTGQQTWNGSSWSSCQVVSCDPGYEQSGNRCIRSTPIVRNCSAGSQSGYSYGPISHGWSQSVSKTQNGTPSNGSTSYTATASCNNGSVSISGESSSISCNSGHQQSGNSCTPIVRNCSAGSQNGYSYGSISHGWSQPVSKTQNGTPSNGSTSYTATASCNNGSVSISGESASISCNSGFHMEGGACVSNTQSCSISNGTWQQTWNGSSWSTCQVVSCNAGHQQSGNACTPNVQYCAAGSVRGREVTYYVGQIAYGSSVMLERQAEPRRRPSGQYASAGWYMAEIGCNNGSLSLIFEEQIWVCYGEPPRQRCTRY